MTHDMSYLSLTRVEYKSRGPLTPYVTYSDVAKLYKWFEWNGEPATRFWIFDHSTLWLIKEHSKLG